jgi:hypothetical protein
MCSFAATVADRLLAPLEALDATSSRQPIIRVSSSVVSIVFE